MTIDDVMKFTGFFIMVAGFVGGIWARLEAKNKAVEKALSATNKDVADHRLHVAENYVSRTVLRETRDEIMTGVEYLKSAVDRISTRIDRISDNQSK